MASAAESLTALNPHCRVETFDLRLDADNIRDVVPGFEVVLDASDNFITRFLVAECCWRDKIPLVSAAATGWHGQLLVAVPGAENPCYRCLVPETPSAEAVPPSTQAGILGAVAGVLGCLQAVEALKLLLGRESDLSRRLLAYDGLQGRFQSVDRVKRADCPLCGREMRTVSSKSRGPGIYPSLRQEDYAKPHIRLGKTGLSLYPILQKSNGLVTSCGRSEMACSPWRSFC